MSETLKAKVSSARHLLFVWYFYAKALTKLVVDKVMIESVGTATRAYDKILIKFTPFRYESLSQDGDLPGGSTNTPQRTSRRITTLTLVAVVSLLLCWLARLFSILPTDPFMEARRLAKEDYIDAVMREPVEGLADLDPIRNRCQMAIPMPGLVWHCDYTQGGLGNLDNTWVGCMLFGIESGATAIVLPRVGIRDDKNPINNGNRKHTADSTLLYDLNYFMDRWEEACPNIKVYRTDAEVLNLHGGHSLTPHEIPGLEIVRKTVVALLLLCVWYTRARECKWWIDFRARHEILAIVKYLQKYHRDHAGVKTILPLFVFSRMAANDKPRKLEPNTLVSN